MPVPLSAICFTGASQQFLVIYVDGPLQNPDMKKEAFPGLKEAMRALAIRLEEQQRQFSMS